ncbi:MAG: hypothetical protein HQM09_24955, partial [Candidatus Riflebacteria bacterium]|nr:hypothetical protein [Candidatus Riflebacteria bacterium]
MIEFTAHGVKQSCFRLFIGTMFVMIFGLFFAGKTCGSEKDYIPLYDDQIKLEDAGKITAKLKELNVDYKLGKTSNDILVTADDKSFILLQLAQAKLFPQMYHGWGRFRDEHSMSQGQSQQESDLNYLRGLQDEVDGALGRLGHGAN